MTSVQMSTRSATGEHFGRRTESGADMAGPVRLWASPPGQFVPSTVLTTPAVGECQTLDMCGQDNQASTRDAGLDAARYIRQTRDVPNRVFIDAPVGLTHDMGVR